MPSRSRHHLRPATPARLKEEIVTMRERVRVAHPVPSGMFEVKHSPGGMVDAEFAVQYLVLSQSGAHPELRGNLGNIAPLERAEHSGPAARRRKYAAANAYRELRRVQHRARLDEAPPRSSPRPVSRARCRGWRCGRQCSGPGTEAAALQLKWPAGA